MTKYMKPEDVDRIIQMAWEDRTPFEAIESQFHLNEKEVIILMRAAMTANSFRLWRTRTNGRATKHKQLSAVDDARFHATRQRAITHNKISKR
jgi:uncharacterized protein (TIGR03643 family)